MKDILVTSLSNQTSSKNVYPYSKTNSKKYLVDTGSQPDHFLRVNISTLKRKINSEKDSNS